MRASVVSRLVRCARRRTQRGVALWSLALIGIVVVLGISYGSQIVGAYYRYYEIKHTITDVLAQAAANRWDAEEAKSKIFKSFQTNMTGVTFADLTVDGSDGVLSVDLDNPVTIPLYGNASLRLDLGIHERSHPDASAHP